ADAKSRWRVSDDVIARRLGDEVIVVQLKTDRVYALNDSAARIWELVASGRSVREIQRAVAEEFAVDPAILERSIRRLLSRLNSRRLLDVRARGS
ncbi:MAG: PqqD family protein, partial [Candidatus Binatia bacterium]